MKNDQINQKLDNDIIQLSLPELRQKWAEYWGIQPHCRIGREMLESSLQFKLRQDRGEGVTSEQQKRLDNLVASFKRDPSTFEQGPAGLKPGTRLVRGVNGEKHVVLVHANGFEYKKTMYTSLSEISYVITGTRWNGWVFFGLKKRKDKRQKK